MDETGTYYTEWSKPERKTPLLYIDTYIWNLEGWSRWPYMWDSKRDTDIKNRLWSLWEKVRVVGWFERIALNRVYYHMWNRSPVQVQCMRQDAQGWCTGMTLGLRWRGRWEQSSGWGTCVYPWLIHVNVWQKPPQYCKVISLQLK